MRKTGILGAVKRAVDARPGPVRFLITGLFGFEIKAGGGPSVEDAKHLCWLRDELGDRFIGGAVLHSGPRRYPLAERIVAAPICTLWS